MKKILLKIGIISLSATPLIAISCGTPSTEETKVSNDTISPREMKLSEETKTVEKNYEELLKVGSKGIGYTDKIYKPYNESNPEKDYNPLAEIANKGDINFFFSSWGTITFYDMIKISMQAETPVVFFKTQDVYGLDFQNEMNTKYFENYLKNKKVSGNKYLDSKVVSVKSSKGKELVEEVIKYATANKDKKINMWWNSDHINHLNGFGGKHSILSLSAFKNVQINLLEDGAAISQSINVKKTAMASGRWDLWRDKQYAVSKYFSNISTWFTSKKLVNSMNKINIPTNWFIRGALTDGIAHSDAEGKYQPLEAWPKIIGLDWRKELDIVKAAEAKIPNKKRLIILGTYPVTDGQIEYFEHIYKKYHNEYNIFYKGHPGHVYREKTFKELETNNPGFFNLEPQIASEELTLNNVDSGMYFDSFISVGRTSAAKGFLDPKNQYLEVMSNGKAPWNSPGNILYKDNIPEDWYK